MQNSIPVLRKHIKEASMADLRVSLVYTYHMSDQFKLNNLLLQYLLQNII